MLLVGRLYLSKLVQAAIESFQNGLKLHGDDGSNDDNTMAQDQGNFIIN